MMERFQFVNRLCLTALVLSCVVNGQVYIYSQLTEHVARLSTLEARLDVLNTTLTNVQRENARLQAENNNLKEQVQNFTSQTIRITASTSTCDVISSCLTPAVSTSFIPATHTPVQNVDYKDCQDAQSKGVTTSGVLIPGIQAHTATYCDMEYNGGGWTVIQRRVDGSVDFGQSWGKYKAGFGRASGEYWLGNDAIHALTKARQMNLVITLEDWNGGVKLERYSNFQVGDESQKYLLTVGAYSGTAGDSFNYPESYLLRHNHRPFSTPDRDNDSSFQHCASQLAAGWWFASCYSSNLNGRYLSGPYGKRTMGEMYGEPTMEGTGIEWYPWKRRQYSLKKVEMKIKHV